MNPEVPDKAQRPRPPAVLVVAVWCWLASSALSLAEGLNRVVSLSGLARADLSVPAAASGASQGDARAALIAATTVLAIVALVFVVVPLRYAFALRQPGHPGRRARTLLTALAIAGVVGTVVGDVQVGVVPFAASSSIRDVLEHVADLLWLLAVITASVAAYTMPARHYLRRQPLP